LSSCVNISEQRAELNQCKFEYKSFQWNEHYRSEIVAKSLIVRLINICEILLSCLEVKVIRVNPYDEQTKFEKWEPKNNFIPIYVSIPVVCIILGLIYYVSSCF